MKFYDYEVEDLSFNLRPGQKHGLAHVFEEVLERRSRGGWRLSSMTAAGDILIFERESTNVESKRLLRGEHEDDEAHDQLLAEGWFFHEGDRQGFTYTRKKI